MVAAKIASLPKGANQHAPIGATSQDGAAEMLNVSTRSVKRAMVAAKISTMQSGTRTDLASIDARSQPQAAEMLNVSRESVQRAAKVVKSGDEKLIADVESGEVTVSAAAKHVAAVQRYPRKQKRPALKPASSPLLTGQQTSRRREDLTFPLTSSRFPSGG
jgi:predicted DNA-binding protein (UPF0251 family)